MGCRLPIAIAVFGLALGSAGCYDPNRLAAPDDVMAISASPERIAADGFSTSTITVTVKPTSNRGRALNFTSSGGTLSVKDTDTRAPDASGQVVVFLISEATPKTVLVTANAKEGTDVVASRSVSVTFEQASAASIIRLVASANQVDADGLSSVQLRAEVNPALTNRNVIFTTTAGSFTQGGTTQTSPSVSTGSDGVAIAQLYATTVGTAVVTATAAGFSASQTITFTPALPDFISLSAKPLSLVRSETNGIQLVAQLSRSIGNVTKDTRVDFTAVNATSGVPFGRFQEVKRTSETGEASATFVPGATAPDGLARITARVPGTNVSAVVTVDILEEESTTSSAKP
jgi:adhesin/invasin